MGAPAPGRQSTCHTLPAAHLCSVLLQFCTCATVDSFDTEAFICEIQARPAIWDTSSVDYSNRELKKTCWEQVVDIFGGKESSLEVKKELVLTNNTDRDKTCIYFVAGLALRKRWKNLRGSFARELQRRKSLKSGSGATRKSQYIYFNQLSFLQTVVSIRESEQAEDPHENEEQEAASRAGAVPLRRNRKRRKEDDEDQLIKLLNASIQQRELRERQAEEDEDRMFLLSLLNPLRGIPKKRKMETKIKIMSVINEAQYGPRYSQSKVHSRHWPIGSYRPTVSCHPVPDAPLQSQATNTVNYYPQHAPPEQNYAVTSPAAASDVNGSESSDVVDLF
ncbi:uncharacterized protein LOC126252430 [Schistocerca nitens]|uniref:uncharacterized protein LOC126252430 n=1 Tax=Schistocerca nitens TaxID=7011 RepID=UPI002118472E|nr:uncharacterized protein LOC126252430 [Schistocerca nitens]